MGTLSKLIKLNSIASGMVQFASDEDHLGRNLLIGGGLTAGAGGLYAAGKGQSGADGILSAIKAGGIRVGKYAGNLSNTVEGSYDQYRELRDGKAGLAAEVANNGGMGSRILKAGAPAVEGVGRSAALSTVAKKLAERVKGVHFSSREKRLIELGGKLNEVINFDWKQELLGKAGSRIAAQVGQGALKYGAAGAGIGAIAGGANAAMSNDPNQSVIGGIATGALTGGAVGAIGGGAYSGAKYASRGAAIAEGAVARRTAMNARVAEAQGKAVAQGGVPAKEVIPAGMKGAPAPAAPAVPANQIGATPDLDGELVAKASAQRKAEFLQRHSGRVDPVVTPVIPSANAASQQPSYSQQNNWMRQPSFSSKAERLIQLSEKLSGIISLAADPRPRNPQGEFEGPEDAPNPHHIQIAYHGPSLKQQLSVGAAGSVVGAGAMIGGKALAQKLKLIK